MGISRIIPVSSAFENGVGFSKGLAELDELKAPPLVPLCLMDSVEAIMPIGIT